MKKKLLTIVGYLALFIAFVCVAETVQRVFPPKEMEIKVIHYIWTEKGIQKLQNGGLPAMERYGEGR